MKTTESGGPRGYDAGKKIKGRKRHIVTDTQGNMLAGIVHDASIQDRDEVFAHRFGTRELSDAGASVRRWRLCWREAADAMEKADGPVIEVVKRPDGVTGFVVIAGDGSWSAARLVRALPVSRKRLGSLHRILRSVAPHRFHTTTARFIARA